MGPFWAWREVNDVPPYGCILERLHLYGCVLEGLPLYGCVFREITAVISLSRQGPVNPH